MQLLSAYERAKVLMVGTVAALEGGGGGVGGHNPIVGIHFFSIQLRLNRPPNPTTPLPSPPPPPPSVHPIVGAELGPPLSDIPNTWSCVISVLNPTKYLV